MYTHRYTRILRGDAFLYKAKKYSTMYLVLQLSRVVHKICYIHLHGSSVFVIHSFANFQRNAV